MINIIIYIAGMCSGALLMWIADIMISRKRKRKKKTAYSKTAISVFVIVCIEILLYSQVVMWVKSDLSALYVLIGVPAAMSAALWRYFSKTEKENSKGGIVYDAAAANLFNEEESIL